MATILRCPITKKLPICPVFGPDGKTYDRDSLFEKAFQNKGLYKEFVVDDTTVRENHTCLQQIQQLMLSSSIKENEKNEWKKKRKKFEIEQQRRKKNYITRHTKGSILQNCSNLLLINDIVKAREYYDDNVICTDDVDLIQLNGQIYMRENNNRKAYDEFQKALKLKPKVTQDIYWDICELFRSQGDYGSAVLYHIEAEKVKGLRNKKRHLERIIEAFEKGTGVKKDPASAKLWAKKMSIAYKDVTADMFLAEQEGLEKNTLSAVKYIDSAAKRDHAGAQELKGKINDCIVGWFDVSPSKRCCI